MRKPLSVVIKSEALRMAKLDYLKNTSDKDLKHPYFWSGFVISGNTDAMILEQDNNYMLWMGIIIFVAIIGVGLLKRRNFLS